MKIRETIASTTTTTKRSNWDEYHPVPVTESKCGSKLLDFPIHTERSMKVNRRDIIDSKRASAFDLEINCKIKLLK